MQFTVPNSLGALREFNPCHRPKGEGGGQFADKGQGNCYGGFRYAPDRYFVNRLKEGWDDHLRHLPANKRRERKLAVGKHAQMLVDKAKVVVRLPPEVLDLLATDGRFKSQHEAGSSRGLLDPGQRIKTEDAIFGEYHDERDRPIYGLMMEHVDKEASKSPMSEASTSVQYGTAIAVLKDSVRPRTTMMFGDSLLADMYYRGMPTPITEMSYLAAPVSSARVRAAERWQEKSITQLTSVDQFDSMYPEAQIHGGVRLRDIDHITLSYSEVTPPIKRALRRLEDAGVKIRVLKSGKPWLGWRTADTITIDGKDATLRSAG